MVLMDLSFIKMIFLVLIGKDKYYKLEKYKGTPKYANPIQGVSKARP